MSCAYHSVSAFGSSTGTFIGMSMLSRMSAQQMLRNHSTPAVRPFDLLVSCCRHMQATTSQD